MTTPLVTHRGWWQQLRDDLGPYLPQLVVFTTATVLAGVWHWLLGWPVVNLAVIVLILIVALQEARILYVGSRVDDLSETVDVMCGPIAPEYEPEPPWMPAEPVKLAPIEPFSGSGTIRPSPFPVDREPKTEPIAAPEPPATVPTAVVVDAEWAQIMADADEFIAGLQKETT